MSLIRVKYDAKRKGYQILKPCDKCGQWNEAFVMKALLEFSEQQFDTHEELQAYVSGRPVDTDKIKKEKESITFVTSLDKKFQQGIAKGINKELSGLLKENEKKSK
jgi:hypothetical protein